MNEKKETLAMCIDLSKAFDCVNHQKLCMKLELYGIRGVALNLIKSYLSNRTQQVVERDEYGNLIKSDKVLIKRGVPQGSILGPFLYVVYTNELPEVSPEHMVLYADDTTLIFSETNRELLLTKAVNTLDLLQNYFIENDLSLNVTKTQMVHFCNRGESHFQFQYQNNEVKSSEEVLFLGVRVDGRLDWRAHVEGVALSIARFSFALKIVSESVGVTTAITVYHAYVVSKIRYGLIFWGGSCDIGRILLLQKRCLRNIFQLKIRDSCRNIFITERLLTVIGLYILESVMFVCNNKDLFAGSDSKHSYDTRHKRSLIADKCNFSYIQRNVKYSMFRIYNSFPECFRSLPKAILKAKLTSYLVSKSFYEIKEFYDDADKRVLK